jgi:hypothetical protein
MLKSKDSSAKFKNYLLTSKEIIALKPSEREQYIGSVILEVLRKSKDGMTVSEVMKATSFNRITVTKHLELLVATREAYKKERGIGTIYFQNGKLVHETDKISITCGRKIYDFFKLENPDGVFLYIQERETDELRAKNVKGGIMIPRDCYEAFKEGLSRINNLLQVDEGAMSE